MSDAPSLPRDRVVETATRLFYGQGYTATGINQVIAEAGVAKATFYHHFPSKEDLALAYLERQRQAWEAGLDAAVADAGTPRDRVIALFGFARTYLSAEGVRGCAFLNMAADFPDPAAPCRLAVAAVKRRMRERVTRLVREARPDVPEATAARRAAGVFLLLEGALADTPAFGDLWAIEAARDAASDLIDT